MPGPDRLWLTDITEHPTNEGKLYCAAVMDAYSRRIIGWSIDTRQTTDIVANALAMAVARRNPPERSTGDAATAGNVVSGNTSYCISLADDSDPKKAVGNIIWGNHIGTDATGSRALANVGDGIQILGGDGTQIGGSGGAGFRPNVIANNRDTSNNGAGVGVANGIHNSILQNSIHDNGGLGIGLDRDGTVLANVDAGANGLQKYPLITAARRVLGVTSVDWDASTFRTDTSETTEIDLYKSDTCDPSGNGEGQTLVGSTVLGGSALPGTGSTAMTQRVASGQYLTAIAPRGTVSP